MGLGRRYGFTDQSIAGSSPIVAWAWQFSDFPLDQSSQQNPIFTYDADGTYTVSLTVTDANGLTDTEIKVDFIAAKAGCNPPPASSKILRDYLGEFFLLGITMVTLLGWNRMALQP